MNHLNLLFPEWQGYGVDNSVYFGALQLKTFHFDSGSFSTVDVLVDESLTVEQNILGYASNIKQLATTRNIILKEKPSTIMMIGGTCASEIAPVSYLNDYYSSDLLVVWFDAHGDLNTPLTSDSKHFHGMPLRALLGESDPSVLSHCFKELNANQVVLAGTRELDPEEIRYVKENRIEMITVDKMTSFTETTSSKPFKNVYIHVDLDVLNPKEFPHMLLPVEGGLSIHQLLASIDSLKKHFNVVGSSIVEYMPRGEDEQQINQILHALSV